jgi:hypothetical protein
VDRLLVYPKGCLKLPLATRIWLGVLGVANGVVPLVFLGHTEAIITLLVFLASVGSMTALAARFGFTRLIHVGRVWWGPLVLYLWSRMGGHPATGSFGAWMRMVIVLDALSLVFAAVSLTRYVRGARGEVV